MLKKAKKKKKKSLTLQVFFCIHKPGLYHFNKSYFTERMYIYTQTFWCGCNGCFWKDAMFLK